MAESNGGSKLVPPYVNFSTFINFIDSLKRGIPAQLDRSLMKTMSGSMQTQVMSALKYLHLVDANGNVKDALTKLVHSEGPERVKVLNEMLKYSYPFLFDGFDLTSATSNQFRQKFTEAGANGDSVRKCIAFFLSAAKIAEVPLSPYIAETVRQTSRSPSDSKPKKVATRSNQTGPKTVHIQPAKENNASVSWEQMLLSKFPSFDPAWPDEVKKEWFTAFHQMMRIGKPSESEDDGQDENTDNE